MIAVEVQLVIIVAHSRHWELYLNEAGASSWLYSTHLIDDCLLLPAGQLSFAAITRTAIYRLHDVIYEPRDLRCHVMCGAYIHRGTCAPRKQA